MRLLENDRFAVDDEGDGWLTLVRLAGGELSVHEREVPALVAALQACLARATAAAVG